MRASAMRLNGRGVQVPSGRSVGGLLAVVGGAMLTVGAAAPSARADVETWNAPFSAALTPPSLDGSVPLTCTIPSFDTHLGARQVTGVRFSGTAEFVATARVQNVSPLLWTATVQYLAGISLTGPGGGLISAFTSQSQTATDLLPTEVRSFTDFDMFAPLVVSQPSPTPYATLGVQSIQLTGMFTGQLALGVSPPDALLWQTTSPAACGVLSVEYTYTLVPAGGPGATMLASGGVLAIRRRRG